MTISFKRILLSSISLWLVCALFGVYFLMNLHRFINFGIDLVGGTYITLNVQIEKAYEQELYEKLQSIRARLDKEGIALPTRQTVAEKTLEMSFSSPDVARKAEMAIGSIVEPNSLTVSGESIRYTLSTQAQKEIARDAIESNITILRNRVDKFGVGEITIASQGDRSIIIELPNVHNPQQAKEIIGTAALLEIKQVLDRADSVESLKLKYGGELPTGTIAVPVAESEMERGARVYLVPQLAEVTGRQLKDARMQVGGPLGVEPVVQFTFRPEGARRFYELTQANIGKQLAIIIDNIVIMAPRVESAISDTGMISSSEFTAERAQQLALLLKTGAFVAPVSFEEERTIGPSLGAASVHQGLIACIVGLALLFLFSVGFYKVAGLLAFIVLLFNLLISLFMLAWLGATLTLPGIAGMILTIGMAIDASILIYERIKEELSHGISMRKAVETGFSGAMTVILDANITHFIVATVLYWLGAGPIQGFAVTMIVGIIATLITGLWMLKSLFFLLFDGLGLQKISI